MRVYADKEELAEALADRVATAIADRLRRDGTAAIAVSGGATPVRFFKALSKKPLHWAAVTVTLVDERWVPADSSRSNAALVKANLLQGPAAAAAFIPLADTAISPEHGREAVEKTIKALNLPFAAVTLGMGNDGHTASFFPGGDNLAEALNPTHGQLVETMRAEAAVEPRITLTLPLLLTADIVAIQIEGPEKRATLDAAMQAGPIPDMPIRAVLTHHPAPAIFWCA